ncbi:MAG: PUA domain-containing protein [Thermoproteota archaeon]|nr:pseudouridine synthase [Candidatus Brockarchaeota archaeon]MBO3768301.1 pseudouridine synthase [Candidatus Brockarchaeota archaeon]
MSILDEKEFFRFMLVNIANYQFGLPIGERLFPRNEIYFIFSKFFNRPKQILNSHGEVIATLDNATGTLLLHRAGARILHAETTSPRFRVFVSDESFAFARLGYNVFCKHVTSIDEDLRVGSEVLVVNNNDELAAVGKLMVPASAAKVLKKGVAVKVRWGLTPKTEIKHK